MINVRRLATALPPESRPVGRFPDQEKRFWRFCWFCDKNEPYMEHWQDRTRLLIGDEGINTLKSKHVLVVGLGGVGAYAAEQLARAGIGRMTIVDGDVVNVTNRNRQLLALESTLGRPKAEVMAESATLIPKSN